MWRDRGIIGTVLSLPLFFYAKLKEKDCGVGKCQGWQDRKVIAVSILLERTDTADVNSHF